MGTEKNSGQDGLSLETLEVELRQMPAPQPPPDLEARLLADITPAKPSPRLWYRAPSVRLAAAAVVIAAVVFGFIVLGGGASLTLAQVQEAVAREPWIHVKYDNGYEMWSNLEDGTYAHVQVDGRICFIDRSKNTRYWYTKGSKLMTQDQPVINFGTELARWQPRSPWEYELGRIEKLSDKPSGSQKSEKHKDTVDGKRMVRFDLYEKSLVANEWVLTKQIWADPRTHLPVKVRRREDQNRRLRIDQWTEAVYEFPQEGPTSVYDMGVPRDVEIVKRGKGWGDPETKALAEAIEAARSRFPTRYRTVIWQVKNISWNRSWTRPVTHYGSGLAIRQEPGEEIQQMDVSVTHRDGAKMCIQRYVFLRHHAERGPDASPALPETVADILELAKTHTPVYVNLWDGQRYLTRRNGEQSIRDWGKPTVRAFPGGDASSERRYAPEAYYWPINVWEISTYVMKQTADTPAGCLGVHEPGLARDGRRTWKTAADHYIDPNRDYIRIKSVYWTKYDEGWRREDEEKLSDFLQLPTGRWYARKVIKARHYVDGKKKEPPVETVTHLDVKVLKDNEFPEGIFDGQKLLEGAKLETY